MSITAKTDALAAAIGAAIKADRAARGDLTALTTTDKSTIVAAINEVVASVASASSIDDAVTNLTKSWSGSKVSNEISAAISNLTGGAAAGYDTFLELQTLMQADDTQSTAILAAQAKRVAVDAAQSFTAGEQTQGRDNIGAASDADLTTLETAVGDEAAFDPVATFTAALV